MATRVSLSECGVPDKVLQTDLVPDWSAGEIKTGVSMLYLSNYISCVSFRYDLHKG